VAETHVVRRVRAKRTWLESGWEDCEKDAIERLIVLEKLPQLFCPSSVAVIGASDNFDKLGYHVMKSLVEGKYPGEIYPINPRGGEIWGIRAYASIQDVPGEVELAIIVVPAQLVPRVYGGSSHSGTDGKGHGRPLACEALVGW
jgi:hypothetical protein